MTLATQELPEVALDRPLTLYRICPTKYADLSGIGAARYPGRWNRKGQRAVYCSLTRSLAALEVLAHLPKDNYPSGYSLLTIELQPTDLVLRRTLQSTAEWWTQFGPHLSEAEDDFLCLIAPSVIVPEYNATLYPRRGIFEPDLVHIASLEPFEFDARHFPSPE